MSQVIFLKISNYWQIGGGFKKKKPSNRIFLIHIKHFTFVMTVHASSCVDPNSGARSSQSRDNFMQTTSCAIKSVLVKQLLPVFLLFPLIVQNFDQALLICRICQKFSSLLYLMSQCNVFELCSSNSSCSSGSFSVLNGTLLIYIKYKSNIGPFAKDHG